MACCARLMVVVFSTWSADHPYLTQEEIKMATLTRIIARVRGEGQIFCLAYTNNYGGVDA